MNIYINIGSKKVGTNGLRYSSNNLEKTWRQHIKTRNSTHYKSVIFNIDNISTISVLPMNVLPVVT